MCVGILKLDEITTAAASGKGNPVIYLGSATGKDGIHGATFASTELDEESESKRPNVQIGDPFAEKQLIEATLEALQTGAIVGIQDMGAAGLTCSTIEMAICPTTSPLSSRCWPLPGEAERPLSARA